MGKDKHQDDDNSRRNKGCPKDKVFEELINFFFDKANLLSKQLKNVGH